MTQKMGQPWIPIEKIETLVQLEPAFIVFGLSVGAWLIYKVFLKEVSAERHRNLRALFKDLFYSLVPSAIFLGSYIGLENWREESANIDRLITYFGLLSLIFGATVLIKVVRILAFEYLFLSHMKVAVPVLIVNLCTLLFSVILGGWLVSEIFDIRVIPLVATSAMLSLVLGLALQDTLGNLFAGVALQVDKPFELGDWVEIQNDGRLWTGKVEEISWRATRLIGWSDEFITIPNRLIAQSKISNFSRKTQPIARSQIFRIPFHAPSDTVREVLTRTARGISGVRQDPEPFVIVTETTENWISFKLIYFIDDFGTQFGVADRLIRECVQSLSRSGIALANPRVSVVHENAPQAHA